ncbi:MAG: MotE family protein [Syntrophaceticus sp.]
MKIFKRNVLLAVVIVIIIAGTGVIVAVKTPFFQEIKETVFAQQQEKRPSAVDQALSVENEVLRERVAELEQELAMMISDSENDTDDYTENDTTLALNSEGQREVYKELAEYYANMKPESAVAILNNHPSQLVAGILHEMEKDQAGEILSRLEPEQAAELIELIGRQASLEKEQNKH